jgi:LEA14-like dessication related protein
MNIEKYISVNSGLARKLVILGAATLLSGCVSSVPVTIANNSRAQLGNVVVSGSGFSESVGAIAAGGRVTAHVRPPGETQLKVAFEVDGQRYSAMTSERIANDGASSIEATVDMDFTITLETPAR